MHNFKVFLQLCSVNLKVLFTYRASFYISFVLNTVWVMSFLIFIEVLFTQIQTLAGLQKGQVLLIMSFYYLFQNIGDILYRENFESFSEQLRKGELDFALVKPASSRTLIFFHRMRFDFLASFLVTLLQCVYSISQLNTPVHPGFLIIGVLYSFVGAVLFFSILSIIATFTFWLIKNESLNSLIWNLSQVARYPRGIYLGIFGKFVTYLLPLALLANIPAEISLQFQENTLLAYFISITIFLLIFSKIFWDFGLKRYSSAA